MAGSIVAALAERKRTQGKTLKAQADGRGVECIDRLFKSVTSISILLKI